MVSFLLLIASVSFLVFWNNTINQGVLNQRNLLDEGATGNLLAFLAGFLGLQISHLATWVRSLTAVRSILEFPDLYLSRPLYNLLLSKTALGVNVLVMIALLVFSYKNRSYILESPPAGFTYALVENGGSITEIAEGKDRVYWDDAEDLRVICEEPTERDVAEAGGELVALGEAALVKDSAAPWPFGSFYLRLAPKFFTFRVKYDWAKQLAAGPTSFSGGELHQNRNLRGWSDIRAKACGGEREQYFVAFDSSKRQVSVGNAPILDITQLRLLLENRIANLDSTNTLAGLVSRQQRHIEKIRDALTDGGEAEQELVPKLLLFEQHEKLAEELRLKNGNKLKAARIVGLLAVLSAISERGGERLSDSDIENLASQGRSALGKGGFGEVDRNVARLYSVFLLKVHFTDTAASGTTIDDLIFFLAESTGGVHYFDITESYCRTGALRRSGSDRAGSESRRTFLASKSRLIRNEGISDSRQREVTAMCETKEEKTFIDELLGR